MNKMAKKHVLAFRLDESDYNKYLDKINNSGYKKSEFFRDIVLKNKTKVIHKQDAIQVIYHHNKMGNNLNQMAYKLNKAFLSGIISSKLFEENLKLLNEIKNNQRNIIDLLLYVKEN